MVTHKADAERTLFKDYFDRSAATTLAKQVASAYPPFDGKAFVRRATKGLAALEFQGRVQRFADALHTTLPGPLEENLGILGRSLPAPLPDCEAVTDGYLQWPLGQFVADHGLGAYDASMQFMVELTQRFSAEFAVRPFVEQFPEKTFKRLATLTRHPSPHVRRWCSEGIRPRLPWGKKLHALVHDPSPIFPILEALKDDSEAYVTRSVANNLNDISKDHPEQVLSVTAAWLKGNRDRLPLIRHALRTLLKEGNPKALAQLGYRKPNKVTAAFSVKPKRPRMGTRAALQVELRNQGKATQPLMIDYVVHFVRQRGRTSEKVFRWKVVGLAPDSTLTLTKQHAFRQTTIRKLYPGKHLIELQLNGVRVASDTVQLLAEPG